MRNIQTNGATVNPEMVRGLMTRLYEKFGKATSSAIVSDAVSDDLGRMRPLNTLSRKELEIAAGKFKIALGDYEGSQIADDTPTTPTPTDDLDARIAAGHEARRGEANTPRPTVELKNSFLPQALAAAERHLLSEARTNINVADRIFQRDGKLVRLSRNLLKPGQKHDDEYRENNALLIVPITRGWLANRLDRSIQFIGAPAGNPDKQAKPEGGGKKKKKKPTPVPKNASPELCTRMLEDSTNWRHPALFGTIETPTLRADGSVLDLPGYDKKTGLFFDPGTTEFPPIREKPTRDEGLAAIKSIEALLVNFPFQDAPGYEGVSLSVAMAAILTGPVRRTLDIAPAFAATAKEAETGKTELWKLTIGIMTGREVSGQKFSDSEEERRKSIGANLRAGRPVLFFDNADNVTIEGDFIEQVITLPSITDRVLAATEEYTAPTNSLVLFNGNDITIGGAMTTRVLLTRMVSNEPFWARSFVYPNLFGHVIENRPQLVAAILTALRAWLVHGEPDPKRATSRFPQWDKLIAQALVWYEYADPMRGGDELREADPVKEAKREIVRQWAATKGDTPVTAADLHGLSAVRDVIAEAKRMHPRDVSVRVVGRYIGGLEDARLGIDWNVINEETERNEPMRWHLKYVGAGDAPEVVEVVEGEVTAEIDFGEAVE